MSILQRRAASGFVKFPKTFEKRIVDGTARFRTKCDVLVGPCACGGVHQEDDDWVRQLLSDNNATIEQLVLAPDDSGNVLMPRYWLKPRTHESCTVLSGHCACGRVHRATEPWVVALLVRHQTKLVGCPEYDETQLPPLEIEHVSDNNPEGAVPGCPCSACEEIRNRRPRSQRQTRVSRSEI